MQQHRQTRQLRQPQAGTHIHRPQRQHARRQCRHAQPGHHGRRHGRNASTHKHFGPGDARSVQRPPRHRPHTAGFGQRGQGQGLARTVLPAGGGEPAEGLFGDQLAIAAAHVHAGQYGIQLTPVVALQQVARRANADLDEQLWVLLVHAGDQRGQLRPGHMVADADGQALAGLSERGQRPVVRDQQFTRMLQKCRAPGRQLHVARRALDEAAAQPVLQPLELQAYRGLRRAHGFGCAREAAQLGNAHKGFDGIQIQGSLNHLNLIFLK